MRRNSSENERILTMTFRGIVFMLWPFVQRIQRWGWRAMVGVLPLLVLKRAHWLFCRDRCQNVQVLSIETSQSMKQLTASWNIGEQRDWQQVGVLLDAIFGTTNCPHLIATSRWLRRYVYYRFGLDSQGKSTGWSTFATFAVSAFWHGFYPVSCYLRLPGAVNTMYFVVTITSDQTGLLHHVLDGRSLCGNFEGPSSSSALDCREQRGELLGTLAHILLFLFT